MSKLEFVALVTLVWTLPAAIARPVAGQFGLPESVVVEGYHDHAMEPFITCDGQVLMFNNRNGSGDQTDIHWAERISDTRFKYRGKIQGANSDALDGVPTVDCEGNFYFVSVRTYFETLSTVYGGKLKDGVATGVRIVPGLATAKAGLLNFDVEVNSGGNELYIAEGTYDAFGGPWAADLFIAQRTGDKFIKSPHSKVTLANINTDEREYAASLSHDGLELFFTRLSGWSIWPTLTIEHSVRESRNHPWPKSTTISSITGFVEAPAVTRDGKILYFHKKMDDGMHKLFLVRRP